MQIFFRSVRIKLWTATKSPSTAALIISAIFINKYQSCSTTFKWLDAIFKASAKIDVYVNLFVCSWLVSKPILQGKEMKRIESTYCCTLAGLFDTRENDRSFEVACIIFYSTWPDGRMFSSKEIIIEWHHLSVVGKKKGGEIQ